MVNDPVIDDYRLPGQHESLWLATTAGTDYPLLSGDVSVDVAVIGGGIVGLTTAWLLKEAGLTVAVIESRRIITGVTGYTTAKITSQHGLIYQQLVDQFGIDNARIYAQANQSAIEKIAGIIEARSIDCDFLRTGAYIFSDKESDIPAFEAETQAAQTAGLPAIFTKETPLPFDVSGAVRLDDQAQFHPRKYLLALASDLSDNGCHIFEQTKAVDIEDKNPCEIITNHGRLKAQKVVLATHFPFYDKGFFYARLFPKRDYVMAAEIDGQVPGGMHYYGGNSIVRSIRGHDQLLLILGGSHKSGEAGDKIKYYRETEEYARKHFSVRSIDWRWSTEDYETIDGVPYIGKSHGSENIYVACGFGGWGMTNGTLSAMIISDNILGRDNDSASFFRPERIGLSALRKMTVWNTGVMSDYTREHLTHIKEGDPSDLAKGDGGLMRVDGKKAAVSKGEDGNIRKLSIHCPHMKCLVNWNNAEKTWDCPCHGSQFDADGKVIHGPALSNLKTL